MRKIRYAAAALAVMGTLLAGAPFCDAPPVGTMRAEAAKEQWVWISSDQKYGKFFSPSNVQIKSKVNGVATCISAWIKINCLRQSLNSITQFKRLHMKTKETAERPPYPCPNTTFQIIRS